MSNSKKRKLRAILFADIVGYTSLMQKDEQKASQLLLRFQKELEEKVKAFQGRIVNFYGDGALCTFEIPIEAIRCAMALQTTFNENPKTPVRIGIHSGTVTLEGEKIFGDSVNITSRIESMGIAGGILFSKKVRDEIKNNPDLKLQSLGSFEFKNVEEPMEVFALANDGFAIPKRGEITGKLKGKKKNKWLILLLVGVLFFSAFGIWKMNSSQGMELMDGGFENQSTPLSKEIRDKRVAVMVFENKTQNENLEDFGTMISDWLTKGLMETGEANVISAANIQSQIKQAGVASSDFTKSTGVGVLIQGRYYLQEDQLIIHANIVDAAKGEVIHALDPIQGHRDKMLNLLDELTQKVLGYWAIKKKKRFLQNPPKYEAYQTYLKANKSFNNDFKKAEVLFKNAFQQDTTFYAPLFRLIPLYGNNGKAKSADSIFAFIQKRNPDFTLWEKTRFEALYARDQRDYFKSAQLNEQLFEMDPSDEHANYNAGLGYLEANYPRKAIEIMKKQDPRYKLQEEISWEEGKMAEAYERLGEYQKVLDVVKSYTYPKMYIHSARQHIRALIRLDSIEKIDAQIEDYQRKGIYNNRGRRLPDYFLIEVACEELLILDKEELLKTYANRLLNWANKNKDDPTVNEQEIDANFYLKNYQKAIQLLLKKIKGRQPSFGLVRDIRLLGLCYAMNGEVEKAENQIEKIQAIPLENDIPDSAIFYSVAEIQVALGRKDEAVQNLQKAIDTKIPFVRSLFKNDAMLKPLFGYPPFEELVKPKG